MPPVPGGHAVCPGRGDRPIGRGLAHLKQGDLVDSARDIEAAERIRPDIAAQFRRWGMTTP